MARRRRARLAVLPAAKSVYVGSARAAAAFARHVGLLDALERHAGTRPAHWLRSLFAIHDLDDMIRLDVPWWTYGAMREVERFLAARSAAAVFEYGSGASTLWLARRAGRVTSVEHDSAWFRTLAPKVAGLSNVDLRLVEPGPPHRFATGYGSQRAGQEALSFFNYATAIDANDGLYDLIVVDGRARAACLRHAVRHLAPDGIILLDNSNRRRYRQAIAASGAEVRRFWGLAPALPYPDETALLAFSRRTR